MTALSITAASVLWQSGPIDKDQVAGEAFVAGAAVYLAADGTWYKAQCDGTAVEAGSGGVGLALATADAAGARVSIARSGAVVTLGTGTAGIVYYVGATAGAINPVADLSSTNKITPLILGIGSSKVQLLGNNYNAGAVL